MHISRTSAEPQCSALPRHSAVFPVDMSTNTPAPEHIPYRARAQVKVIHRGYRKTRRAEFSHSTPKDSPATKPPAASASAPDLSPTSAALPTAPSTGQRPNRRRRLVRWTWRRGAFIWRKRCSRRRRTCSTRSTARTRSTASAERTTRSSRWCWTPPLSRCVGTSSRRQRSRSTS